MQVLYMSNDTMIFIKPTICIVIFLPCINLHNICCIQNVPSPPCLTSSLCKVFEQKIMAPRDKNFLLKEYSFFSGIFIFREWFVEQRKWHIIIYLHAYSALLSGLLQFPNFVYKLLRIYYTLELSSNRSIITHKSL